MQPLLFDEGLSPRTARAFSALGLKAHAVGEAGAPARGGPDELNVQWCVAHGAVLVTNDRGRKDREIVRALEGHNVSAIFVPSELRSAPAHHLARALLKAESKMDHLVHGPKRLHHLLRPGGGLEKR